MISVTVDLNLFNAWRTCHILYLESSKFIPHYYTTDNLSNTKHNSCSVQVRTEKDLVTVTAKQFHGSGTVYG